MDAWLFSAMKEIQAATDGFTPAHYRTAPPGKWNADEILEHLSLTYKSTARLLRKLLAEENSVPVRGRTMTERVAQFVVCTMGVMPDGRKSPTFAQPKDSAGVARSHILTDLEEMDRALADAEHRWGRKVSIAEHPILGPMSVNQWRRFHHTHTKHHMKQVMARAKIAVATSA